MDRVDQLTPRQRDVLRLVGLHRLSLRDAARIMGCTRGATAMHLLRAIERLRRA